MIPTLQGENKPWYRHSWPWLLMAGPFIVVVAGVITMVLAVVSNDGLVADDYYKQGLAVNQLNARDQVARSRGLGAEVMRGADARQIRVLLNPGRNHSLPPTLILRIAHPTRSGTDQKLVLRADDSQSPSYSGQLSAPLSGRWQLSLEDETKEWRLIGDWVVEQDAVLHLPTVAPAAPKAPALKREQRHP